MADYNGAALDLKSDVGRNGDSPPSTAAQASHEESVALPEPGPSFVDTADVPGRHTENGTSGSADRKSLFQQIIACGDKVFYKSQQRDEADLMDEEKIAILDQSLSANPTLFLERYHMFMTPGQLLFSFANVKLEKFRVP